MSINSIKKEIHNSNYHYDVDNSSNYTLFFNGYQFNLLQYHFHKSSEHALNGALNDMEVHFVHKSVENNEYLVFGFFIDGSLNVTNDIFDRAINLDENVVIQIPQHVLHSNFYFYNGSLTTSAYQSIVNWLVFDTLLLTNKENVDNWDETKGSARPLQDNYFPSEILYFHR